MQWEIINGVLSGAVVAPVVSIVDKAIFSNASGKATFGKSLKNSSSLIITNPVRFFRDKSFLWVWAVYSSTYAVSNATDKYARTHQLDSASTVLTVTSATNITMSVLKDRAFSRMFGTTKPRPLPHSSLICYATRDFITIFASFTLVQPVADELERRFDMDKNRALTVSQIFCPLFAQLFNTPIFLFGMDLYNRPLSNDRIAFIKANYWKTFWSRVARIGPAFSVGGVVNHWLRENLTSSSGLF